MIADPAVEAVVRNYQAAADAVRSQVAAYASASWGQLQSYWDDDIGGLVAGLLPLLEGGKQHTADLTAAYLAAFEAQTFERPPAPVGVPSSVVSEQSLRGVEATTVYTRAGVTVWTALAKGAGIEHAAKLGGLRLQAMLATDLQLAKTHASRYVIKASPHIVGYRRVTDGAACGLCTIASERVYKRGDLLPIHPHCSCSIEPLYGSSSAGQLPAGEMSGQDAGDTPAVHMHGEIGPVLAVKGQHFTDASDVQ